MSALAAACLGWLTAVGSAAPLPDWPTRLDQEVVELALDFEGRVHLYVEDVRTSARYRYAAQTPVYLASGVKLVVMAALYHELEAGRARLEETTVFRAEHVRDGSPLVNYLRPGTPVSLGVLLEAMIQSSDNAATDLVIERIGVDQVNQLLPQHGLQGFGPITTLLDVRRLVLRHIDARADKLTPRDIFQLRLVRPLERRLRSFEALIGVRTGRFTRADHQRAFERYYREGWNSASMEAMGGFLARLVQGSIVSPAASAQMLEVMRGTRTGVDRLRAGLPPSVVLAHKTGTQHRRTCDFGVFFVPPDDRPVVIAAVVEGGPRSKADAMLAALARATYRALTAPDP